MITRLHDTFALRPRTLSIAVALFAWSAWLAFLAETRVPLFHDFAIDVIFSRAVPTITRLLLSSSRQWKVVPLLALALIAALIVVRRNSSVLRILCATTIVLLILACVGMTFLVTEGVYKGVEFCHEQMLVSPLP